MIESNINDAFAYLNAKKCANHPLMPVMIICLHPKCWNGPQNQSFLCYKCTINHFAKEHDGNEELSIPTNLTFTKELNQRIDEIRSTLSTNMKNKHDETRTSKMINEAYETIEKYLKNEFKELQIIIQENTESRENMKSASIPMKKFIEGLQKEISLENNYKKEEKLKEYCINIKELERKLDKLINENKIESEFNYDVIRKMIVNVQLEVKKALTEKIKEFKIDMGEKRINKVNCKAIRLAFYDGSRE